MDEKIRKNKLNLFVDIALVDVIMGIYYEFIDDRINHILNIFKKEKKKKINKKSNSYFEFQFNNKKILPNSKRSQVTIFIILALIMVVSVTLIFLLIKKPQLQVEDIENPQAYIDSCVSEFTEEAINILSEQGGDIAPEGSTMFRGKNITYLCYNANYYSPCIMQRPDLIMHIEDEITGYIEPKVENCFNGLKSKLEKKNYNIEMGNMQLQTKLQAGKVVVNIDRDFKMTKREETRSFDNFRSVITHPIDDLAEVAMEIANQEAKYCNFDTLGYMIFYPEYNLDKFRPGDGDVIYYLRHVQTNKRFVLAVRSCALPPGF